MILLLLLAALAVRPAFGADTAAIMLSEPGGAYEEVADALRGELSTGVELIQAMPRYPDALPRTGSRIVVAVGTQACRRLAESEVTAPILCVLLPRAAFEHIAQSASPKGKSITALLLDQPASRQMALLRLALPDRRNVAVLLGPDSSFMTSPLAAGAARHGLKLTSAQIRVPDEVSATLQRVLSEADVLLAVPDSAVFNSGTTQNILRTTFQRGIPLVAFSPAYVTAGALLALYTTPAQVGRQAGGMLRDFLAGRALPRAQSPSEFQVSANRHVARSLGIELEDEAVLTERLRKLEQKP
jgi:putative ABC transport system substrate-binding protein